MCLICFGTTSNFFFGVRVLQRRLFARAVDLDVQRNATCTLKDARGLPTIHVMQPAVWMSAHSLRLAD